MENFEKEAIRVSKVSIYGNLLLSVLKLLAGIIAHSQAMVSDAIHSASDVISSFVVIIGVKLAAKEEDEDHPYGHERLESVAAIVLAIILAVTGIFIGHTAVERLTSGAFATVQMPGVLALVAAIISIAAKEGMYWYTRHYAKKIDSSALMADAWHHRSDALSSVGSLIGIAGARMGYLWFDSVASLIICVFILKAAYDIFKDAINKMVDHSCETCVQKEILECAESHPEVMGIDKLQTREFGNKIYVNLSIFADGDLTLRESDRIAEEVHDSIEERLPKIKHIFVVVKPFSSQDEQK